MTDCSYGDSIDDVEGLIGKHQAFVEGQMPVSSRNDKAVYTYISTYICTYISTYVHQYIHL